MVKIFTFIKIILIISTALFVSFHTVIFIKSIEPSPYLAWILAAVIEGFLITLAIQKTIVSKLLLIPLFCISVLSSSASFVVKNEDDLLKFLNHKTLTQSNTILTDKKESLIQKQIKQIEKDITSAEKELETMDRRYTTKTLERKRKLEDMLQSKIEEAKSETNTYQPVSFINYITPYKALIFLIIVFVLQSVSLYTASHMKNGLALTEISKERTETSTEISTENPKEISTEKGNEIDKEKVISLLKSYKKTGKSLSDLSKKIGISTSTLSKALSYPTYPISDEVFIKIRDGLDGNFNKERG